MNNYIAPMVPLLLTLAIMVGLAFDVASQRDNLKTDLSNFKKEAVSRGFAEWKVVGENKTEFTWKEKQ